MVLVLPGFSVSSSVVVVGVRGGRVKVVYRGYWGHMTVVFILPPVIWCEVRLQEGRIGNSTGILAS